MPSYLPARVSPLGMKDRQNLLQNEDGIWRPSPERRRINGPGKSEWVG